MRRRAFLGAAGLLIALRNGARAQGRATRKIGFLHPRTVAASSPTVQELRPVWEQLGYAEPDTVLLRSAEDRLERLPRLAAELLDLGAGVLIAVGPAAVSVASRTGAPVVAIDLETDPIRSGLAASFARPGGNVTGLFLDQPSLAGKWLELLQEAVPAIERVALVWDPATPSDQRDAAASAARFRGIAVVTLQVSPADEYETKFQGLQGGSRTGAILLGSPGLSLGFERFARAAERHRLPTMTHLRFLALNGALMSYGPRREGYWSRAVMLADRILNGDKPGDLPIERPPQFELVVNLKTAKALGLELPTSLLARADEVVE